MATPTSPPPHPPLPTSTPRTGRSPAGSGPAWSRSCSADTLSLAEWAATATSWTPPVDTRIHLGIAIAALVLANLVAIAT